MRNDIHVNLAPVLQVSITLQAYLCVASIVVIHLVKKQSISRHLHVRVFEQRIAERIVTTIVKRHRGLCRPKSIRREVKWLHRNRRATLERAFLCPSAHGVVSVSELLFFCRGEIHL